MPGTNYPKNFKTVNGYDANGRLVKSVRYWRHDNGKLTLGTHIWWPGVEPVEYETINYEPKEATK